MLKGEDTFRKDPLQSVKSWWQSLWAEVSGDPNKSFRLVLASHAPRVYNNYLDHFQKRTVRRALKHVGLLGGMKVLDIGCGSGRWTKLWTDLGAHVVGVDVSVPLLRMNFRDHDGQDSQKHFAAMEAQNLGFESKSFDMASSVTVLQHIPYSEQRQAIHEIVRCVKPGGWILIYEHIRKPQGLSAENATTFSNSPRDWVEMFVKENCQLLFVERCPLMPLFAAYWFTRDQFRKMIKAGEANSLPEQMLTDNRSSVRSGHDQGLANRYRHMRSLKKAIYWLLTWPSWALEFMLFILPRKDKWTDEAVLGAHQTFLFRREGEVSVPHVLPFAAPKNS